MDAVVSDLARAACKHLAGALDFSVSPTGLSALMIGEKSYLHIGLAAVIAQDNGGEPYNVPVEGDLTELTALAARLNDCVNLSVSLVAGYNPDECLFALLFHGRIPEKGDLTVQVKALSIGLFSTFGTLWALDKRR